MFLGRTLLQNPARALLARGRKQVRHLHPFDIETLEGARKVPLHWPLVVFRFTHRRGDGMEGAAGRRLEAE